MNAAKYLDPGTRQSQSCSLPEAQPNLYKKPPKCPTIRHRLLGRRAANCKLLCSTCACRAEQVIGAWRARSAVPLHHASGNDRWACADQQCGAGPHCHTPVSCNTSGKRGAVASHAHPQATPTSCTRSRQSNCSEPPTRWPTRNIRSTPSTVMAFMPKVTPPTRWSTR